jgi:hypothetical protein
MLSRSTRTSSSSSLPISSIGGAGLDHAFAAPFAPQHDASDRRGHAQQGPALAAALALGDIEHGARVGDLEAGRLDRGAGSGQRGFGRA